MAISVKITSATLTEGNSAVSALMPAYTYLRDRSVINYSFSVSWSGASKVSEIESTIEVRNAAGRVGWVLAKTEKTTALSGTRTYTGTVFVNPVLSSGYGPALTSLDDGTYTVAFNFCVYNGTSGDGVYPIPSYTITYATLKAPVVTSFDVYRANSVGTKQDDGVYLRYNVNAYINKVLATDTGTFVLRYRQTGSGSWNTITLGTGVTAVNVAGASVSGTFPVSISYDFELVITDRYTTVTSTKAILTAGVLMHFKADKTGVAIGKYSEYSNMFDVALPTKLGAVAIGKLPDSGNTLDCNYPARFRSSVSMDSPLPVTSGGTGATSLAGLLSKTDVRAGVVSGWSINKTGVNSYNVTFSPARTTAPTAVIASVYGSTASNLQYWAFSSGNFTTTGCTIYAMRTTQESGTGTISFQWIAI